MSVCGEGGVNEYLIISVSHFSMVSAILLHKDALGNIKLS